MGIKYSRADKEISFDCDRCSRELDTECTAIDAARAVKKAEGWKTRKDSDGELIDVCPSCSTSA